MDSTEKCPLNQSMLKAYCSHCQGTARGTRENPAFSVKQFILNGSPMIEILKDGGAVHMWDSHFQFGTRKAEMMIVCIDALREFWMTNGDEKNTFVPRIIENGKHNLRVRIYVQKHEEFDRSDGVTVERPYLHLQAQPPQSEHIGLGLMKCRAICEVEAKLVAWLQKCSVI